MSNKPINKKTEQPSDESLGLEHLPQAELEASPAGDDAQPAGLELDEAGIVTTKTIPTTDEQNHE